MPRWQGGDKGQDCKQLIFSWCCPLNWEPLVHWSIHKKQKGRQATCAWDNNASEKKFPQLVPRWNNAHWAALWDHSFTLWRILPAQSPTQGGPLLAPLSFRVVKRCQEQQLSTLSACAYMHTPIIIFHQWDKASDPKKKQNVEVFLISSKLINLTHS